MNKRTDEDGVVVRERAQTDAFEHGKRKMVWRVLHALTGVQAESRSKLQGSATPRSAVKLKDEV